MSYERPFEKPKFNTLAPEIQQETLDEKGRRVVNFNRGGNERAEKPSYELISYKNYIKREAELRGLKEKRGMMVNPHTGKIDRGNECEIAILGRCQISSSEMIPVPIDRSKLTYHKAKNEIIGFVKRHQPIERNEQNVSREIEDMVKSKLRDKGVNILNVRFYTAVGSPLDYQYGIDGWIEITDSSGKNKMITFDLKTGNYSDSNIQADIMLKLDVREDGFTAKQTLKELFDFTNKVVEIYIEKNKL